MADDAHHLQVAHDKLEIHELLARYARGCDTQDWELLTAVFTPDAVLDFRSANGPVGPRDEVVAWLREGLSRMPVIQHVISNIEVELDGDTAAVRAMFLTPMRLPGSSTMSYCGGYYLHDVVRTEQGWRSARLVEQNRWFSDRPS